MAAVDAHALSACRDMKPIRQEILRGTLRESDLTPELFRRRTLELSRMPRAERQRMQSRAAWETFRASDAHARAVRNRRRLLDGGHLDGRLLLGTSGPAADDEL